MTKTEFIKKYGARGMCVTFKSRDEIDSFLKQCEGFGIKWLEGQLATQYKGFGYSHLDSIAIENDKIAYRSTGYPTRVAYELILTPKQMIKDGWSGINRVGTKIHFLPSINKYVSEGLGVNDMSNYLSDLSRANDSYTIMTLYDADRTLQWTRQEKSTHDLEIERIESEMKAQAEIMNKLAIDLVKLKGGE